jgi:hypothetical protein
MMGTDKTSLASQLNKKLLPVLRNKGFALKAI